MERQLIGRVLTAIGLILALSVAPSVGAEETLEAKLQAATRAFEMQDYDRAIERLRPLIAAEVIEDPNNLRQSLERLGASYWFTGAVDAARLTFGTLLKMVPDHPLDPLYYPQELIGFFEAEKQRLKDLGFIGSTAVAPPKARPKMTLVKTVTERTMPTIGYLMPFGVGQFANQESGKGALLAVLQGIGIATNIAAWIAVEAMKQPGTNLVASGDAGRVEVMEILWWIGSSLFVGSYTYGVIDGLVLRPPSSEEQRRFEMVDPEDASALSDRPSVQVRLGPGPGFGLGVTGAF